MVVVTSDVLLSVLRCEGEGSTAILAEDKVVFLLGHGVAPFGLSQCASAQPLRLRRCDEKARGQLSVKRGGSARGGCRGETVILAALALLAWLWNR